MSLAAVITLNAVLDLALIAALAAVMLLPRRLSAHVEPAAARVRNEYEHLDVLINNAGTAAPRLGVRTDNRDRSARPPRLPHLGAPG